jgi:hypothetical protein
VRYDAAEKRLVADPAGWWLINFPLDRIAGLEGKGADEISHLLFGTSRSDVRNWYLKTPGPAPAEPPKPTGPAPIRPSGSVTYTVSGANPFANDESPGTAEQPLRTIGAALERAKPGDVVRVEPGVYREVLEFDVPGTPGAPIRVEGQRDAKGRMPVIDGNDPFPAGAWKPVAGMPGVYRAELFTGIPGLVSTDDTPLHEASWAAELEPGEFCLNRASYEFLDSKAVPRLAEDGGAGWRRIEANEKGMLILGEPGNPARYFLSTWVWVEPKGREEGVVWDPRFPEPISGKLACKGPFRAFRQTGTGSGTQVNKYRMWVDGQALPSAWVPGQPRPHHNYGKDDLWHDFVLKEGWNHLVFEFDTSAKPEAERVFRFGVPKGIKGYVCSATRPQDGKRPDAKAETTDHVSEGSLLGPLPATADGGVYVRLPGNADPNQARLSLSKRTRLATLDVPFVELAGFEFRYGAYFQQRPQVMVSAPGCVVEGCLLRDSEVRGITVDLTGMDQTAAPVQIRNNWVLNPGGVGIGASGSSNKLTPENQDGVAPGRGRLICEYNLVSNNNCHGYARFWESGGFKMFRLTGAVLRNNTFIGGDGPAIWLDWEHYGNRVEGNVSLNGTAFGQGVEASPGPNLIANNLCVNLKTGGVWFRHGVLAWSSHAVWAIHNTVDGRWNDTPAWNGKTGAGGIYLHEGNANRGTRWGAVPKQQAILNNLVVGVDQDDVMRRWGWNDKTPAAGNHNDTRKAPWSIFRSPESLDYRLLPTHPDLAGDNQELVDMVKHDFHGLLRFPDLPRVAGAFRVDPPASAEAKALVEVELSNGTMRRLY